MARGSQETKRLFLETRPLCFNSITLVKLIYIHKLINSKLKMDSRSIIMNPDVYSKSEN